MELLQIDFFSTIVNLWLFTQVNNASHLRNSLIQASQTGDRAEQSRLDWAFIDASMVTSRQHLITAICQALVMQSHGELKTRTLHSEILWTLSPGTNIVEAIKKFGMGPQTTEVLLVKLHPTSERQSKDDLDQAARSLVEGTPASLDLLGQSITNWKELRRLYKLNEDLAIKQVEEKIKNQPHPDLDTQLHSTIDQLIISTVALKSVAA